MSPATAGSAPWRPPRWTEARLHLACVFGTSLAVYAFCAPRSVAFEDDGDFIMAVWAAVGAHPPGYPLWVLLAMPFQWLPVGSVAFRIHLSSAVFGAAACALLWWLARGLGATRGAAYLAALGLAFSPVFWSQAIVAEVYTLNVLAFFALLALSFGVVARPSRGRVAALGLVFGASLSNHWPFVAMATPCLALVLWPARAAIVRAAPWAAAAALLGLAPYGWMALRSQADPALSFYGPLDGWRSLAAYVSLRGYPKPSGPGADAGEFLRFAWRFAGDVLSQLTPVGAALAAVGVVAQWRRWGALTSVALLLGFGIATVGLALWLRPSTQTLSLAAFRVFPLVPYGIMALWAGAGADAVARALAARTSLSPGSASAVLAAPLVAVLLLLGLAANDRHADHYPRDYAAGILESLPPDAEIFTLGDSDTLTLGYLHHVEGLRPDVELMNQRGLVFPNRLFSPFETAQRKREVVADHVRRARRPVFFVRGAPHGFAVEDFGFYERASVGPPGTRARTTPELLELFRRIAAHDPGADLWRRWHRERTLASMRPVLEELLARERDPERAERYREDLARAGTEADPR